MTGCQDLLSKLLVAKEGERIDMQTLMRHPWVNDNCPMLEPCKKKTDNFNEMDLDSTALEVRLNIFNQAWVHITAFSIFISSLYSSTA